MDAPDELDRLALAWQGGDREAFRELVLRTGRQLRVYVGSFCDSPELIDEIVQATYVALFERIGRYRARRMFLAWLQRIARNLLMDHWRRRRRLASLERDALDAAVADSGLGDLERADESAAQTSRLRACLERLPARAREMVELRHLEDRSLEDLAQRFGRKAAAIAVALHRARQALRACMERAA